MNKDNIASNFPFTVYIFDSRSIGDSDDDYIIKRLVVSIENGLRGKEMIVANIDVELINYFEPGSTIFKWPYNKEISFIDHKNYILKALETVKDEWMSYC